MAVGPSWLTLTVLFTAALAPTGDDPDCPRGRIAEVSVVTHGLFDEGEIVRAGRWAWAYRTAERLHSTTRPDFVRRELVLTEGDCYDPQRAEESARVLRAAPFIARAEVEAFPAGEGDIRIVATVWDDWSLWVIPVTDPHDAMRLQGFVAREENLAGTGQEVGAHMVEEFGERTYGLRYANRQIGGTRLQGAVEASHTPMGPRVDQALFWPFVGDRGRWAFRQDVLVDDRYFDFIAEGDRHPLLVLVPERRRSAEIGGVYRFRQRDQTALVGVALTGEWIRYGGGSRFFRHSGELGDTDAIDLSPIETGLDSVASVRGVVVAGHRDVRFVPRLGIDAVRGVTDVKLGTEIEIGIGRSIRAFSTTEDLSLDLGLFAGTEWLGGLIVGMEWIAEGKRDYAALAGGDEWKDVFLRGAAWSYYRPIPESRHTWAGVAHVAAGWAPTVPFQLSLDRDSGVRGRSHIALGAQRVTASLEHRYAFAGPLPELIDVGSVVFVDAGRIWPGDAPFASGDPESRLSVGVGLRAGFPTGSSRAYRIDFAYPLVAGEGERRFEIRASAGQAFRIGVAPSPQMERSSRRPLGASLFSYPN